MTEMSKLGLIRAMEWWKRYPIYQIYPRSFKDTSGNGVGDLKGVAEKLPYLEWLGIKSLWISPIYKSPMLDFGYDISDYRAIDPLFGSMDDFRELLENLHSRDMHLIMDFVPNHTSDQHPWFISSKMNQEPYSDYYVWRDGVVDPVTNEMKPPNDVMSVFGGAAWTWCEERRKYYLHHFLPEQPNLNYNSRHVRREMIDLLKYWVDLGVDGFRVDAVVFLGKDEAFQENATDADSKKAPTAEHAKTFDVGRVAMPSYEILGQWVKFLKENYEGNVDDGGTESQPTIPRHIFVCTEGYTNLDNVLRYYDTGVDFPFNFSMVNWNAKSKASDLRRWVNEWMKRMPHVRSEPPKKRKHDADDGPKGGRWPNWVTGNHDQSRVATRLGGQKYANVVSALLLTLPGTPTCYQGDELGMIDVPVTFDQCQDPYGKRFGPEHYSKYTRDPCRSPMVWESNKENGGFTSDDVAPWLPLSKDKAAFAVDVQKANPKSYLNFFRRLVQLRDTEPTFHQYGHNVKILAEEDESCFVYERCARECDCAYVIVLNVGRDTEDGQISDLDLSAEIDIDRSPTIVLTTCAEDERNYSEGRKVDLASVRVKPAEVLVLRLDAELEQLKRKHCTS